MPFETASAATPLTEHAVLSDAETFDDDSLLAPTDLEAYLAKVPIGDNELPPVIAQYVKNAPACRKIPSLLVALVCLSAICTRLRMRYTFDNRTHMPLLNLIIEGEPSAGKGFANQIVHEIIEPTLGEHDAHQRLAEQEYRELKSRRKANEKLPEPPKTTIRVVPAHISKTVLVRRADMSKRFLGDYTTFWMYSEELAQLTDAGRQAWSSLRTILRVGFDKGSFYGLDYASDNSYSAIVDILMCTLFLATPNDVDEFMDKRSIMGGNCTRNIIYPIKDDLGSKAYEFKSTTPEQHKIISQTLQHIMDDTYMPDGTLCPEIMLDMSFIDRTVRQWCAERSDECLGGTGRAYYVFHKRSSLSAFRAVSVCKYLYDIAGVDEGVAQRRCKKLYRWLASLIHTQLLNRWGGLYDQYNAQRFVGESQTRKPLIDQTPSTFTRTQLEQLIKDNNMVTEARFFLSKWKEKG